MVITLNMSTCLSVCRSICLSVCRSVCVPVCVYPPVCLPICVYLPKLNHRYISLIYCHTTRYITLPHHTTHTFSSVLRVTLGSVLKPVSEGLLSTSIHQYNINITLTVRVFRVHTDVGADFWRTELKTNMAEGG